LLLLHNMGEDGRMARDGGLAFHLVFGVFLAGYAACSALAREIRGGTAATVLAKPVGRGLFFAAKYAGVAAVVALYSACAALATLLAERSAERFVAWSDLIGYVSDRWASAAVLGAPVVAFAAAALLNYRTRRPFQSSAFVLLGLLLLAALLLLGCLDQAGRWAPYDLRVQWRILPASLLVTEALLVFAAAALALSTRLTAVPVLTACAVLLLTGLLWSRGGAGTPPAWPLTLARTLVPDWQHFWVADGLARGGRIPPAWIVLCTAYATALTLAALSVGAACFHRVDVT
jgi:hypothetical protein